ASEVDDDRPILPSFEVAGESDTDAPPPPAASPSRDRDRDREEEDPAFAQIFVNIGRREGARPGDFYRLIVDQGGVPREETGRIRIRDKNSFVSVKKEWVDRAIAALAGQTIGGRSVVAE